MRWPKPKMSDAAMSSPPVQLSLRLAAFLAGPVAALTPEARSHLTATAPEPLRQLASTAPHFAPALARFLRASSAFAGLKISASIMEHLQHPPAQRALSLALAPVQRLVEIRAHLAGALYVNAVRGALLKPDRTHLRNLLGAGGYALAQRKAGAFYSDLARLSEGVALPQAPAPLAGSAAGQLCDLVLADCAAGDLPLAGQLLSLRLTGRAPTRGFDLTEAQRRQIWRCAQEQEGVRE